MSPEILAALLIVIHRQNMLLDGMAASFRLHEETAETITALAAAIVATRATERP